MRQVIEKLQEYSAKELSEKTEKTNDKQKTFLKNELSNKREHEYPVKF